jgi:1-acyl-sn-glycerol-3-phosphate acyltransferase
VRATIVGHAEGVNASRRPRRASVRDSPALGTCVVALTRGAPAGYRAERDGVSLAFALKLIAIAVNTVLLTPLIVAAAAFVDARRAYDLSRVWAMANLRLTGVGVHSIRRAALDPRRPYVFMSNHASHFDALAVVAALPEFQLRWVAKKELLEIPFFGWALRRAGHIIIDRSNPEQAIASLRAAKAIMDTGVSVVIFPEGTREGHDHELLPLKKGGFMLAMETGAPIVPLAVRDSRAILPRDDWRIRRGIIDVVVGEPIAVDGESRETLTARVESFLRRELGLEPVAAAVAR